ncbi:threonine/serine dehydratase [Oceanomicrobium pacificus]|uniref:Pyridoxal-phosphate dependent enzyme n=1 Tax=Oceanomicrobium pacificus TaxID=2692916 RepID=A0A6B0TUR4_9RHOB|nr:threonine/serine dehydratase [Oceanomicrobium pacificus]MXU64982.1 pyridoxal-phosphate dependent enzyme [Oceanomicrobium pacificus]
MTLPITPDDIRAAHARIRSHIRRTPVLEGFANGVPQPVTLKLESLQHAGSFKARGAFNSLLSQNVPKAGVVAASGGNHGAAVAYAAAQLGHPVRIFVPEISAPAKVNLIRRLGAEVIVTGRAYADALAAAEAWQAETGALSVHAYDAPDTVAGQGTTALELDAQAEVDTLLVAVGGGGFIGGIAAWYGGQVRVIAVEPENAPTYHAARAAGAPVDISVSGVAADSLGARRIGSLAHAIGATAITDSFTVPDAAITEAQKTLWHHLNLAVEPGGATALAALTSGAYRPEPDERVGVMVCGANVDLDRLAALV